MLKLMAKVMAPTAIVLAIAIAIAATPVLGAQAMLANPDIAAVDGRSFTFPSNDVLRMDTTGAINRNKLRRGALIGGLVTGVWCALVCGQALDKRDPPLAVVALVNGGYGAAIGSLIGFRRVLEADLSPIDLRRLTKTWTPVPQSQGFGASLCDGVTIQRRYDAKTGVWQPGVEIAAGPVDTLWDELSINVRVRVTVRNPKGGRDTKAHVTLGLRQDGRSQVTAIASIDAGADEESSGDAFLRVPRALLSRSSPGLSLQVALTTSYPR